MASRPDLAPWHHRRGSGVAPEWHEPAGQWCGVGSARPHLADCRRGGCRRDGKADLIWHHGTTGAVAVAPEWHSLRGSGVVLHVPDLTWQIVGVGDVDGDGKADLIWHHGLTGAVAVWLLNGTSLRGSGVVLHVPDLTWQVQ